jgi:hypothetical protein
MGILKDIQDLPTHSKVKIVGLTVWYWLFLLALYLILPAGCAQSGSVHVKHHSMIGYSDTWEITDGTHKVGYYNGDCCCVADIVVDQVANLIKGGVIDWPRLATDKEYQKIIMGRACKENKGN